MPPNLQPQIVPAMPTMSNATILLLALVIDAAVGDPEWLYRAIAHPTVLLGRLIDWLDQGLNNLADSPDQQRFWGIVAVVVLVGGGLTIGWVIEALLGLVPLGWVVVGLLMSPLIAQNGLYRHVGAVADGLDQAGLAGGRNAVAHVVGRDPEALDEAGVARAALESLAENFSDAATARLDDLLNLAPARLAGPALCGAAFLLSRAQGRAAWQAMWRDARKHHSPNAGWPEAAMAGALGLALGGPRVYDGELADEDAWLGDGGRTDATSADIR